MTQAELARGSFVSLSMLRKIEQGHRFPSEDTLDAIAGALEIDASRLLTDRAGHDSRVRSALPALSDVIGTYDIPEDGPVRPLQQLRTAVQQAVDWRLSAQYTRIIGALPGLLGELARALDNARGRRREALAGLLTDAYRAADAVAYKYGAYDLSARLVELMRWAGAQAGDPLLDAAVAYVRTETFFAARAHGPGLRALERALDAVPPPATAMATAARGALHMRAAVIAARVRDADRAGVHLESARELADRVREGVYQGTAFGPDSVRVHEVSVAVGLGDENVERALHRTKSWTPPPAMGAERRSGFYIELARAQLWAGRPDEAFTSLGTARSIAPQHTREHPWAREDAATLRRLKRADAESLTHFVEWIGAV